MHSTLTACIRPGRRYSTPPTRARPRRLPRPSGSLRVATFNVENYFPTLGSRGASSRSELERQRQKLAAALRGVDADIVSLTEVENRARGTGRPGDEPQPRKASAPALPRRDAPRGGVGRDPQRPALPTRAGRPARGGRRPGPRAQPPAPAGLVPAAGWWRGFRCGRSALQGQGRLPSRGRRRPRTGLLERVAHRPGTTVAGLAAGCPAETAHQS
jgi:hypothetical protein